MPKTKKIIIGVDIRDLRFAKTGQKTYLEELYKQFSVNQDNEIDFIFLDAVLPIFSRKNKLGILLNHVVLQYWKQLLLPIKAFLKGVDLVFCTDYFAPNLRLNFKHVQVFHDAFFYEYPEHYHPLFLRLFQFLAIPAAKKSSYIICPTEYAKKTIHQHIKIPLQKIIPIYEGPKTFATNENLMENELAGTEWEAPREPYILNVGVWEKRKNIPRLLGAFKQLLERIDQPLKLVLVGEGSQKMNSDDSANILATITSLDLQEHVICTGYLSDASLAKAYQKAALFVFPSYNEGFGVPVLEAFHFKVPVLVANNSCLPEVGGDAVFSFDPFSEKDLADQIIRVLENSPLQTSMIEMGQKRLEDFSWKKTSEQIVAVFKLAVSDAKQKARIV